MDFNQIFSKLATAWADATTTDNVVDGAVQWHQWGLMCEIIVAVSISTPEAWKELKLRQIYHHLGLALVQEALYSHKKLD